VRHAHRQPVNGDLHHQAVGDGFELDGQVVEALRAGQFFHRCEVRAPAVGHGIALK
jgi:hypothetical protein